MHYYEFYLYKDTGLKDEACNQFSDTVREQETQVK